MAEEEPKSRKNQRGPGWRIRGKHGIIGRAVGRTANNISTMIEKVKLPERKEDEQQPESPEMSARESKPFLFSESEPEVVPEHEFKSHLVDESKKNQPLKRVRRM
jgi:hypothetical protein